MSPPTPPAVADARAPSRPSRREDQSRATRQRLLGAAIALVTEVGWRRTTVEQIAERAGVAKGTFFVHFRTKEAIAITLVEAQIAAAMAAREAVRAAGGSPVERLRAATMRLGDQAAANLELSRAVLIAGLESRAIGDATDAIFNQLYTRMIDDACEALERGLLEGPDADTIVGLVMACYLGATLHCTSSPRARPLAQVLAPLVDATLGALGPRRRSGAPAASPRVAKTPATAMIKTNPPLTTTTTPRTAPRPTTKGRRGPAR
jgi:AcrR family transcriptional regulator